MKIVRPTPGELVGMIVLALIGVALIFAIFNTDWFRGAMVYVVGLSYTMLVLSFNLLVALRRERQKKE